MRASTSKISSISIEQQEYLLMGILQQRQQNFAELWQTAFGCDDPPTNRDYLTKNQQLLYRLKGKGLVLLQTNFSKKPKNPV